MATATSIRKIIQFNFYSRCSTRRPAIVVNSIPKAGTHLAVQILKDAGLTFTGHFPKSSTDELATNHENIQYFSTAHTTTWRLGNCKAVLLVRDPVDVVMSMIMYIKKRRDHPRHDLLNSLSISEATTVILEGANTLEPLAKRYKNYYRWARENDVRVVDFSDLSHNPSVLFERLDLGIEYTNVDLDRAMSKWNPTKRTVKLAHEKSVKNELRQAINHNHSEIIDVYKDIKSLT